MWLIWTLLVLAAAPLAAQDAAPPAPAPDPEPVDAARPPSMDYGPGLPFPPPPMFQYSPLQVSAAFFRYSGSSSEGWSGTV